MKIHIVYIGLNGFPKGLAALQRQLLITKGLNYNKAECKVICRYGVHNKEDNIKRKGSFENIEYSYASPLAYRHPNVIVRSLNKIVGYFFELFYLVKFRKSKSANILLSARTSFLDTISYRLFSLLFGYKYVIDINEAHSYLNNAKTLTRLNHFLFDNYCHYLCDGIVVISDFLFQHFDSKKLKKPIFKLPVVCDIAKIESIPKIKTEEKYFMYCASAGYKETAEFVIKSFINTRLDVKLILVLSGNESQLDNVRKMIELSGLSNQIILKSNIPYEELIGLYKSAQALLIPLPETFQHKARFPHKMAEYAACKVPIISNRWGESLNYFSDESLLFCDRYDVLEYSEKMKQSLNQDEHTALINNAYTVANERFDCKIISAQLISFIKNRII